MAEKHDIVDERWLSEYFEFGWADLLAYLTKWARFARWCQEHDQEEAS